MWDLKRLLQPKTIAVIGGGVWCKSIIEQCQKIGFSGAIWPVHPHKDEIANIKAYKSVKDLPAPPDAAFIGVNREATISIVKDLSEIGAGGAVCFASGFSESKAEDITGEKLQQELMTASGSMPSLGPNCYGFINYLDKAALWPDQHGGRHVEKGVAILTQSSNIAINMTMQTRGLPIAYVLTMGNQAKVSLARAAHALLNDERVTALGCHIEGFGNITEFEELSRKAHKLGKPIIALKVGKSDQAQNNTISHTASLAGTDIGAQAALERLGIGRVHSIPEFIETLKLLHLFGPLKTANIASLSCSGGEASLMADAGLKAGTLFPELKPTQIDLLRQSLGPRVALSNPLDYHTYIWHDLQALQDTFSSMTGPHIDLTFIVLDFPRADKCDPSDWENVLSAIEAAAKSTERPFGVLASLPENMPEAIADCLLRSGILPMCGFDQALNAVKTAAYLGTQMSRSDAPAPIVHSTRPERTMVMSEHKAKVALSEYGVTIPEGTSVKSTEEAGAMSEKIGFPVVIKGENIAHKSEHAAVHLNLQSKKAVTEAAEKIPSSSYLIEKMVDDNIVELLIGITRDEAHGLLLTIAAGGIYTEILKDSQTLILPVSPEDIDKTLSNLKIAPMLEGYRSKPAINRQGLIDTVLALQSYVQAKADDIEELEINPLICGHKTIVAADALIRIAK